MDSKWNYWLKSYCHLVSAKMPTGAVPGADRAYETALMMSPGGAGAGGESEYSLHMNNKKKGWLQTQ